MKANKTLISCGVLLSVGLVVWFVVKTEPAPQSSVPPAAAPAVRDEAPVAPAALPVEPVRAPESTPREHAYQLAATDPSAAMNEAERIADVAARKSALQDIMALWLRKDRLAAADWMLTKKGRPEYDFLSAQVSDAFFPDDTEMSAMFAFDLSDASLRDERVNKLVAYWKSGAHLKFDNSPWEVDPAGSAAAPVPASAPTAQKP